MSGPADLRPAPVAGALATVLCAALLSLALWPAPADVDALTPVARSGELRERPERPELATAAVPAPAAPAPPPVPAPVQPTAPTAPKPAVKPAVKPAAKPADPVVEAPAPVAAKAPAPAPAPVAPPPVPASAAPTPGEYADRLVTAVNAERRARGLAPLSRDSCADGFADRQAARMAAADSMSHQDLNPVLDACGGNRAAENVGYGDVSPERLVELWMASASHRKQVLEPALTHLGSGAVRRDDGRWYASHVFIGR